LGKPALGYIEGDFLLHAALKELPDMACVLGGIIGTDDDVVHNASLPREPVKGFIHALVIML